jgi:serine/threonine-protein kinase
MNCFKCATPLPDGAKFCFTCGTDVSGEHGHGKTVTVEGDPELQAKLQADIGTEYVIERELGRGGMAIVYLGHDASLGRKVAVKLLPPELTFGSSSTIERFKREARTSATLDHPNIIPVYRVSQGQKLFWYVMKFLEGESLDHVLEREGQLAVDRTVDIIRQTADALDYAHQNQVIHRDIKPANIMLDGKGRVTVTDFGIAKALDAHTLTATGAMIGTPYYMSPEQCSGKRVGPASDQYALAVMTFQMLGGHLPFTGDSVVDIIHKHVMDPIPPLAVLRPQLPAALVAVVERGLAKHPDERFATCAELAKALGQAAQGMDVTAAPPRKPSGVRLSKTALVSPVPGAIRTAKGTWADRKVLLLVLIVVAGAGAFGIGALIARIRSAPDTIATGQPADAAGQITDSTHAARPAPQDATPAAVRDTAPAAGTAPSKPVPPPRQGPAPPAGARASAPRLNAPGGSAPAPQVAVQAAPVAAPAPTQPAPPAAAAPAGNGFITVGSRPQATIAINGRAVSGNPVNDAEVPAGAVRVRFTVTDSTGVWTVEKSYVVEPGEHKRLGRIQLTRP